MHVIIPVAGVGTRLRPHTHTTPKVLLPVAGKPILGYILDEVVRLAPDHVTLVVGYLGEKIQDYVVREYDLPVRFVEQPDRKGLGHAVGQGLAGMPPGPVLVVLGDTIIDMDLPEIVHREANQIGVCEVDDPRRFGVVESEGNRAVRLVEKPEHPRSSLAIVGIYYFLRGEALRAAIEWVVGRDIRTRGEYQLTDAIQALIDQGEMVEVFPVRGWHDCGKPETLLATNRHLLATRGNVKEIPGSIVIPPVYIADGAQVESSIIGPHVSIAPRAAITRSIISDTIITEGAQVTQSLLTQSIVGEDAIVRGARQRLNVGDSSEIDFSGAVEGGT